MDTRPGTVVVGVDGSDSSYRALEWAIEQARSEHRAVTLVHTVGAVTPAYFDVAAVDPAHLRTALQAEGTRLLVAARTRAAKLSADLEVHEVLAFDDAREVLVELSRTAAMVVLGSRGRSRLPRLLLGSVGVTLVRQARCPVVIHRPGGSSAARPGIVVGADGSADSLPVLELAYREAALRRLPLTVLHCFWDVSAATASYSVGEPTLDPETERMRLAQSLAGMSEEFPDVEVHTEMAKGLPQEALVRAGEGRDLLVVGAHRTGRISRMLFGSVAVAVVEHATVPVAVVPLGSGD